MPEAISHRHGVWPLTAWWVSGLMLSALLLAWPLLRLSQTGSFAAALATGAGAGLLLLACWRAWPVWRDIRHGQGDAALQWQRWMQQDIGAWRGLKIALPVALLLGGVVVAALPGVLPDSSRWGAAAVCLLLFAGLHLQGRAPRAARVKPEKPAKTPRIKKAKKDTIAKETASKPARNVEVVDIAALADAWPKSEAVSQPLTEERDEAASPKILADQPRVIAELYEAARAGRVERALVLLEQLEDAAAPPPEAERDRRHLPQIAAVLPDLRLLRALIARGVDLNAEHGGAPPLLAATRDSWHGRPDAVTMLLANGADPRARDAEGQTPLHHAARSTDAGVAALLLDAGAELDALDETGQSPLAQACESGNWRLAKFLIERGARVHPAGGQPVLLAAAAHDEDEPAGVQLLLRHKAAINVRGRDGVTALQRAARAGNPAIAQTLLDAGADPTLADDAGDTPWLLAADAGALQVLQALQEAGAKCGLDAQGRDALIRAVQGGRAQPELIGWLREHVADTAHRDADGKTALDHAVAAGRWSLVAELDPSYRLPDAVAAAPEQPAPARDLPASTLFREALLADDAEAARSVVPLLSVEDRERLLLEFASTRPAWITRLPLHGLQGDACNARGDSAATLLVAQSGRDEAALSALRAMLEAGLPVVGAGMLARYLTACSNARASDAAHEAIGMKLFARGADPFKPALTGESSLLLAIRLGWQCLVEALLQAGMDPNRADARGLTPLHVAAALGRAAVVPPLLLHGAQPQLAAGDGQTPLGVALANGRRDIAGWLDWRGWPHPGRHLRASDLPAAAIVGDGVAVRRLLDFGFPVDMVDAQGCTALLRAAGGGHLEAVETLLQAGADTRLAAQTGATPLSAAVSMRHGDIVQKLVEAGADLDQRLPGDVNVLMLASALGMPDIASRLLKAGADVHAADAQGLQPLHCAALHAFGARDRTRLLALLDTLIYAGAEVDAHTEVGLTPLLLLLGARAEPGAACEEDVLAAGLDRLLDEGVSLSTRDQRGFGPLHLAALHGLREVMRQLLRAGAAPELRDTLNRTPADIAQMRGYIDLATELANAARGAPPSVASLLRPPK